MAHFFFTAWLLVLLVEFRFLQGRNSISEEGLARQHYFKSAEYYREAFVSDVDARAGRSILNALHLCSIPLPAENIRLTLEQTLCFSFEKTILCPSSR